MAQPARAPLAGPRPYVGPIHIPTGIGNGTRYRIRQLMTISTVRHYPLHQFLVLLLMFTVDLLHNPTHYP